MHPMHRTAISTATPSLAAALLAAVACSAPQAQEATSDAPEQGTAPITGIRLIVDPFTDLYFLVRAQAAGVVPAEPELQPIIDAWMPVQEEIGTFGGFWMFDLPGLESTSPEEFEAHFASERDGVPSRAGGTIPLRGPGVGMAAAMREVWPAFRDQQWPTRSAELAQAVARLEGEFLPKHRAALAYMMTSLGIEDPGIEVPMYLVLEAHPPGASTYRSRSGPVAVLSTNDLLGEGRFSDLAETILHEACHALDLASESEGDVFSELRRKLEERGADRRRVHDITHLVMFAQAEETMRRLIDPEHVAYGDTWRGEIAPLYERSGEDAVTVRREWSRFLSGEISREQALDYIAEHSVGG